jgi:SAM-dependent methyltransferase
MNSTQRFSDRVANYVKYRPGYPEAVFDLLAGLVGSKPACADFGSGTGIFSRGLLTRFDTVYGIEPNAEMRAAGERELAGTRFVSVAGTAEASTLADGSVALVTAAQAFHWFDPVKFQTECRRILRPDGQVALIWNNRLADTPFLETYDRLLRAHATDYNEVNHQNITAEQLGRFFERGYRREAFPNVQRFDLEGLLGRLDSSSYAPQPDSPEYGVLRAELARAFNENQVGGTIDFRYETEVYHGGLGR